MDLNYLFTSFEGRINRKPYWIGVLIMVAAAIVASIVLGLIVGFVGRAIAITGFLLQLALAYPSAALMAKRLHDRNRPTWWVAFLLVPTLLQGLLGAAGLAGDPLNQTTIDYLLNLIVFVVAIWFLIELGILRGTVGPNQYGPDPLEGQG